MLENKKRSGKVPKSALEMEIAVAAMNKVLKKWQKLHPNIWGPGPHQGQLEATFSTDSSHLGPVITKKSN